MTEWVLVPREPTAKMVLAAFDAITNASGEGMICARWRCMLDAAPAAPQQAEPVAWRDHVEQRLHTWRQRFVNRSGDQLALDDFMDKRSIDDLIDYVCDEYVEPKSAAEVQRLRDALKPFAAIDLTTNQAVDPMDVLRARRALEGK